MTFNLAILYRERGPGTGLTAGDGSDRAMGDSLSPEEKLNLITRNLQVGPRG